MKIINGQVIPMVAFMKKEKKLIVMNLFCIGMFLATILVFHILTNSLISERAAGRWASDGKGGYAQVSCYIPENQNVTPDSIDASRAAIKKGFTEYSAAKKVKDFTLIDAYSAFRRLEVKSARAAYQTDVYGVSGNFFFFHNYDVISGSCFRDDNLMQDLVVLDEALAWELFGSSDIVGQQITINGYYFTVSGVVKKEKGYAVKKTYGGKTKLYLPYGALKKVVGAEVSISCYEAVMPEPIEYFSYNLLIEKFGLDKEIADYKDNSKRFKEITLFKNLKNYWKMVTKTNGVRYPFWENAAVVVENLVMVILLLKYILLIVILVIDIKKLKNSRVVIPWFKNKKQSAALTITHNKQVKTEIHNT